MKSARRIGLLLPFVILLPALAFSVYELSTLNKDEEMIQEIYAKQLEAILFSVNQYADDVVGNWIARAEAGMPFDVPQSSEKKLDRLLELNPSIRGFFVLDSVDGGPTYVEYPQINPFYKSEDAIAALSQNEKRIRNLVSYRVNGFQKVEQIEFPPMAGPKSDSIPTFIFVMGQPPDRLRLAGFFIDPRVFIEDVVGPRLQVVARDQFILSVLVHGIDSAVYTTHSRAEVDTRAEAVTKALWLMPDYVLGIRTAGETLQQIVRERTYTNFALLAGLDVILIIAAVIIFRNLKREVDLAQNKTEFVSNVSHELRTPLALISMFAETLELDRVPSEEKKREYYHILSKEAQRLTGIVNKILTFSQTEARKKQLNIEALNLDDELRAILNTYDFHLRNKGFDYSIEGVPALRICADREAFIESLVNIVDNAMKYSEDVKRLVFTRGQENGFTWIAVKDFGVGISKEEQKHIFDKFYRVPGGNLARSRGTGLGLSLVKQLMEEQNGKILVESTPGKGTTFTLCFPSA